MVRVRGLVTLATLLVSGSVAAAQPADPYGPPSPSPSPTPAPTPSPSPTDAPPLQDLKLAEQIAASLVARAQDLFDARELADAKQLAVEAVVASPHGAAADQARVLIHQVNQQLGIPEEQPPRPPPAAKPPQAPEPAATLGDGANGVVTAPLADTTHHDARTAAAVHGGLYAGVLGATLGTVVTSDGQAGAGVALGAAAGVAGAVFLAPVLDRHFDEAQIRTMGSGTVWGGVIGGLMADITTGTGPGSQGTTGRQVMIGASIGSTAGALGGYALATQHKLTRGDVALVDTLAGIGTMGGLTIGMLMQPAESEAYDLNAVLGAAGGIAIGLIAAPGTNTTQRRMLRVATYAAIGGGVPFVLYAAIYDPNSSADERVIGLISTLGLVGGAYLGFRTTAHWDEGLDVLDGARKQAKDDAPPAVVGRASDGSWQLGTPGLVPLSRQLDNHQHGVGLTLVGATF